MMMQANNQPREVLHKVLQDMDEHFLTKKDICHAILKGDPRQMDKVNLMDAIGQTVVDSLRMGEFRRATWYLYVFGQLGKKLFR